MIALLAHPRQGLLVQNLLRHLPVAAIYNPWRGAFGPTPVPVYHSLKELLATHAPQAVCFLCPHPRLPLDLVQCLDQGIRVLSAGPVEGPSSRLWHWGGQHRFAPLILQALAQRQGAAFGQPVYLRRVIGGGTDLWQTWWSACQLLSEGCQLIGSEPTWVQLAATRHGRAHHLVLSLAFVNGANAHLVVAPVYFSPSADLTLLGSGGLLFSETAGNTPVVVSPGGAHLHPPAFTHPEPAWIAAFLAGQLETTPPAQAALQLRLLPALRRALRQGLPVRVEV